MDTLRSGSEFNLFDVRDGLRSRRALMRSLALEAIETGADLEALFERVKSSLGYFALPQKDRDIVRTCFKDVRAIVTGWRHLRPQEQEDFRSGRLVFSTLAKRMRSS